MTLRLFLMFTKLGFLSVGGGYPMMALILEEAQAVGLTMTQFADMAALELLASGPIAINAATYIGYVKGGFIGAVAATAGTCVSPLVLTTILYYFLKKFSENVYVQSFLDGIKVACGGILITTTFVLSKEIFFENAALSQVVANPLGTIQIVGVVICIACCVALIKFKANPIGVILASGLAGALFMR